MNKYLKILFFALLMSCNIVVFAQAPGDNNDSGDLEDVDDPPAAPIDGKLIWLSISGIALACYCFVKKTKECKE